MTVVSAGIAPTRRRPLGGSVWGWGFLFLVVAAALNYAMVFPGSDRRARWS
jgi:hypothetical protein